MCGAIVESGTSRRFSRPSVASAVRSGASSSIASSGGFRPTTSMVCKAPPPLRPSSASGRGGWPGFAGGRDGIFAAGLGVGAVVTCVAATRIVYCPDPMKFSPDYVRIVLDENFEDAKTQLLEPLMAIEYAHLVMLADRKIVTRQDAAAI